MLKVEQQMGDPAFMSGTIGASGTEGCVGMPRPALIGVLGNYEMSALSSAGPGRGGSENVTSVRPLNLRLTLRNSPCRGWRTLLLGWEYTSQLGSPI